MEFSSKKLTKDKAANLKICSLGDVRPYELLLSPAYLYFRANEKFISLKGPLDFFTPEELAQIAPFENIFFTQFLDQAMEYREAGAKIRRLLELETRPAEFEVSDQVLRILACLWGSGGGQGGGQRLVIEPFFLAGVMSGVCNPLSGELLVRAREQNVARFEYAILLSSWTVFLALHLGYLSLELLSRIRDQVFNSEIGENFSELWLSRELEETVSLAKISFSSADQSHLSGKYFENRTERVARKLSSRLKRVQEELIAVGHSAPTIFGDGGFLGHAQKKAGHG